MESSHPLPDYRSPASFLKCSDSNTLKFGLYISSHVDKNSNVLLFLTVNTPSTQSTPVVVEQPTSQPELTDEYYANLAQWGMEFVADRTAGTDPGVGLAGQLE